MMVSSPRAPDRCTEPQALVLLRRTFEQFDPLPGAVWTDLRRPWRLREGDVERHFSVTVASVQRLFFTTPDGDEHTVAVAE